MSALPAYIRAVPWDEDRARNAVRLARATGARVIWDRTRSIYDTFLRALAAAGAGPGIFLEDDVTLTSAWRQKAHDAIAERPGMVHQFFSMRGADLTVGSRDEPGRTFLMAQCFYLPPGGAAAAHAFAECWPGREANPGGVDMALAAWMQSQRMRYRLVVPSLVEHNPWPSVTGRRSTARQSLTFLP